MMGIIHQIKANFFFYLCLICVCVYTCACVCVLIHFIDIFQGDTFQGYYIPRIYIYFKYMSRIYIYIFQGYLCMPIYVHIYHVCIYVCHTCVYMYIYKDTFPFANFS